MGISNMTDRELLVQIHTEMQSMKEEMRRSAPEIKELSNRVTKIETHNAVNSRIASLIAGFSASVITIFIKYIIGEK